MFKEEIFGNHYGSYPLTSKEKSLIKTIEFL